MTPKSAYDDVARRAQRLLRLHDGLVNTRKRRIRADWKRGFCQLMHWPKGANIDRVDSKDVLLVLRDGSQLKGVDFTAAALDDLLRASLAMAISALDRYLHERVVKQIIKALRTRSPRRAQELLGIPAILALRVTEEIRRASLAGKKLRPANHLRKALQESLHTRPFQSWREIEEAFELIGITGLAGKLQTAYAIPDIRPIKSQLGSVVQRRNQIVHEGDLIRHQRGGKPRVHGVTRKYVADTLVFLDTFVGHLEGVG